MTVTTGDYAGRGSATGSAEVRRSAAAVAALIALSWACDLIAAGPHGPYLWVVPLSVGWAFSWIRLLLPGLAFIAVLVWRGRTPARRRGAGLTALVAVTVSLVSELSRQPSQGPLPLTLLLTALVTSLLVSAWGIARRSSASATVVGAVTAGVVTGLLHFADQTGLLDIAYRSGLLPMGTVELLLQLALPLTVVLGGWIAWRLDRTTG